MRPSNHIRERIGIAVIISINCGEAIGSKTDSARINPGRWLASTVASRNKKGEMKCFVQTVQRSTINVTSV